MGAYDDLMQGVKVKPNRGFFERAAERVTNNWNMSQGEIEEPIEQRMEREGLEQTAKATAQSLENFAVGAYQGARELVNAGRDLAKVNPVAIVPGTMGSPEFAEMEMPEPTEAQMQAENRYRTAASNFSKETLAPMATPAAFGLSLAGAGIAATALMSPFVIAELNENTEKYGLGEGVLQTGKSLVMPAALELATQAEAREFAAKNPYQFRSQLAGSTLGDIMTTNIAVQGARSILGKQTTSMMGKAEDNLKYAVQSVLNENQKKTKNNVVADSQVPKMEPPIMRDVRTEQELLNKSALTPEEKLNIDSRRWGETVDNFMTDKVETSGMLRVMDTPAVMNLVDAELLPIEISSKNLSKILKGKHKNEITPDIVKQLPKSLTDPIMILDTYDGNNGTKRRITVLELTDKNNNTVVVPFELKKKLTHYEINEIKSVYGKNEKNSTEFNKAFFQNKIDNGEVLYVNNKKADAWAQSYGLRLEPKRQDPESDSLSSKSIPNETDLANRLKELNSNGNVQYALPRRNGLRRNKAKAKKENVKPVTIKEIESIFNSIVPTRTGGVDKKYLGLFKIGPEVVRSRVFKDYDSYSHELGHYLDKTLDLRGSDAELIAGAEKVWGDNEVFQKYSHAEKRAEGVAEFVREALIEPAEAKKNFPGFYNTFMSELGKPANKGLAAKLDKLADALYRNANQTSQAKGRAVISFADDIKLKPLSERTKEVMEKVYTEVFDDKNVIKNFVDEVIARTGENVKFEENPYLLARSSQSSASARSAMLLDDKGKPLDIIEALNSVYNNKLKYAVTLQDIFKDVNSVKISKDVLSANGYKDNRQAFSVYLVAKRQLELQGIYEKYKGPMSKEVARQIVDEAPEAFVKASAKVQQHFDNVLSILEDGGLISAETHKRLNDKYKHYVPMYRDKDMAYYTQRGYDKNKMANIGKAVKSINEYGSSLNVLDPLDSLVLYTQDAIQKAENNKVGRAMVAMKDVEGIGRWLEERPDLKGTAKPDEYVFTVWENGEKRSYQAAPELYDAMINTGTKGFEFWRTGLIAKAIKGPADIMRAGATGTPAFGLFNFARDTITASLYSQNTTIPVLEPLANSFIGVYKIFMDPKLYNEFKAAGVPMSTRIKSERANLKWQKLQELPVMKQANLIWQNFIRLNQVLEEAPRVGEFAAARRQGKSIFEAGMNAREITMDFSRGGRVSKTINKAVPFFNVALQSTDRMIRELKNNPVRISARLSSYVLMPAAIEWLMLNGEDWYEDIPAEIKDKYLFMKFGDNVVRTPLPQEFTPLVGGVKRILSSMRDKNMEAMTGWEHEALDTLMPDFLPAFMKPFIEWQTEYNFFTKKDVVPKKLQNLPDKEQYDIYTSMAAIKIGAAFDVSPKKVDNFIQNVFATTGTTVNAVVGDWALGRETELPAKNLNEMPVIGRFGYTPGKHSKNVDDFYKLYDETSKEYNAYGKQGKNAKNWNNLKNTMKKVRALNKKRQAILNNPRINARDKRILMDKYQQDIVRITTMANERYKVE